MNGKYLDIIKQKMSKVIVGTASIRSEKENFILWDKWYANGVNAFDTSFHYDNGRQEKLLGKWISNKHLKNIVLISKNTLDENIDQSVEKLKVSLDRLKVDKIDFFLFHRTFSNIDIEKYLEVCNKMLSLKLIKCYGFSNISHQTLKKLIKIEGKKNNILISNNFSYAKMFRPPWEGVYSCNEEEFIKTLETEKVTNFSWSSQAMGFFHNKFNKNYILSKIYQKLFGKKKEKKVFLTRKNSNKFKKLKNLAKEKNMDIESLSLSWVFNQNFPSYAIVNVNNSNQISSIINSCRTEFSEEDKFILNK